MSDTKPAPDEKVARRHFPTALARLEAELSDAKAAVVKAEGVLKEKQDKVSALATGLENLKSMNEEYKKLTGRDIR